MKCLGLSWIITAALLQLAIGGSRLEQHEPSHGAEALAPPHLKRTTWGRRAAVSTGHASPVIHLAGEVSPRPCSPTLYSAPNTEMNEGTTNSALPLKPRGRDVSAVMLFVDFSDLRGHESTSSIYRALVPRAQHWFDQVSYGRLRLRVTAVHRWFRMPLRLSAYDLVHGGWLEQRRYIADAVGAADSSVDFTGYEVVYVVAPNGTRIARSPAFQA